MTTLLARTAVLRDLRPKTIELYRYLLRRHLLPAFGSAQVTDIREPQVRRWRKERLDADVSPVTVAKAYRLLKAIMNTASDDELIRRNPCRIKGASVERSPERPVLSVQQVFDLAEAIDSRYRALVLLAVFGSMRWRAGRAAAMRRRSRSGDDPGRPASHRAERWPACPWPAQIGRG